MRTRPTRARRAAFLAALLVAATAGPGCSSDENGRSSAAGDLRFELTEWKVTPQAPTTTAGKHTLTGVNTGKVVHSIMVIRGTDMSNLPARPDGGIDQAALGARLLGAVDDLAPGKSGSTTVDLTAGTYTIMCNMAGMAAQADQPNDMHTTLTVRGD